MVKFKASEEWIRQAKYDLDTAKAMFKARRYIYTVFMCHLSVEKGLKGLFVQSFQKEPPKSHDLNYLCNKVKLNLPEELRKFMDRLNDLSVPSRYPDELDRVLKQYDKRRTEEILKDSTKLLLWLKRNM